MSKRTAAKAAASAEATVQARITSILDSASTGHARSDRHTAEVLHRLTRRLPILSANPPALEQLVGIVYGGLKDIRKKEDRIAELCEDGLKPKGAEGACTLCSWEQKAFCEECGTDFSKTRSRAALPLFIPTFSSHRLHVDLCMLCSDRCVDELLRKRTELEAAAEAAAAAAAAGGPGGKALSTEDLKIKDRRTKSASDPHLSVSSFVFHSACYCLLLYTLHLGNYSLHTMLYFLTAWMLLAGLLLHGLWLMNILFSWSAGGGVSSVYRLRQALSLIFSVSFVLTTVTTILFWALMLFHRDGVKSPGPVQDDWMVEHMKHTMPMVMMLVEWKQFPHVKLHRTVERISCVGFACLYLLACYHQRFHSHMQRWPYPFFSLLTTPAHFGVFLGAMVALLVAITVGFQKARDAVWRNYVVPRHLLMQS
jgi:hypothetical protein